MDWSDEQKEVLNLEKQGTFVVKACPGSGKTTCISERIYRMLHSWDNNHSGIALLSFTNVAKDEVINRFNSEHTEVNINYPHYFGTLDSFINKFIFLPYGHLVMGCKKRPELVGSPFSYWSGNSDEENYFDKISFNKNGKCIDKDKIKFHPDADWKWRKIIRKKKELNKKGYATQKDAIYYSMKVLEKFQNIAKSLAIRFPYFIIDEAQDSNENHMAILELLIKNGLNNCILVGDPEQGIYEWNRADPLLLNQKFETWDSSIEFKTNYRSSQNICNFFSKLSSLNNITSDVNFKENDKPVIKKYDKNYNDIIDDFIETCKSNNIEITKDSVAILFRGEKEVQKVLGFKNNYSIHNVFRGNDYFKTSYTKNILLGKFFELNKDYLRCFQEFEKAYIKLKNNSTDSINTTIKSEIEQNGLLNHRQNVFDFMNKFPKVSNNQNINDWIENINNNLDNSQNELNLITERKNNIPLYKNLTFRMLDIGENITENNLDYDVKTIHKVKGKSYEAVLLILKNKGIDNKHYKTMLDEGISLMNSEELRIVYVGMTRAKKLLWIAVPKKSINSWENKFKYGTIQQTLI